MHEVARDWSVRVAHFLIARGCQIDREDKYGRTPLCVAVAANYTQMVRWLVKHGGEKVAPGVSKLVM